MSELIRKLFETKKRLQDIGMVMSDNEASSVLLGKSRRYVSWLRATGHEPAIDAMVHFYIKLDDLHEKYSKLQHVRIADKMDRLSTGLWDAIRNEVLKRGQKYQ